ncbi:MAG: SixA phosphatase family protein, partial [Longimicrobiales bacterium]
AQDGATTVIVVRHAERAAGDDADPPLSEAGHERARALLDVAARAGVEAVYTTQYRRTRETAVPLATALGVDITIVEVQPGQGEQHARELAQRILNEQRGRVVLVVGHSNTAPLIVQALGAGPVPQLGESAYDNLYLVTVLRDGTARLIHARYGAQDPS